MKTKNVGHTPGPWVFRQTADTFHTGRPVFGVGPKRDGAVWFVAEQIYEDDARLIAAAPDLLEAAKMIMQSLDKIVPQGYRIFGKSELFAAIEKAENGK